MSSIIKMESMCKKCKNIQFNKSVKDEKNETFLSETRFDAGFNPTG